MESHPSQKRIPGLWRAPERKRDALGAQRRTSLGIVLARGDPACERPLSLGAPTRRPIETRSQRRKPLRRSSATLDISQGENARVGGVQLTFRQADARFFVQR